jgi:hypothetical protein
MKKIVTDPFFEVLITFCILANTFFMTLEKYPKDAFPDREPLLDRANKVFTVIFIVEMVLKIIGLTPHLYFKEQWNIFDSVVIMFSILELALSTLATNLAVLRAFRLLRILKLAKSWPTLNKLIRIIGRSLGNLGHLSFVLFIVLFIFAVIGMQLFRADYLKHFNDGMEVNETTKIHLPRWHFIDFPHAFLIVFRIQCGEWVESMFECMKVSKPKICIPIFITVFVIGNLVILNLFLALLLNSFSGDVLQQTEASSNAFALAGERIQRCVVHVAMKIPVCLGSCQQFLLSQWKKHFAVTTIKEPANQWDDEFIPIKAGVCGVSDAFSRSPSLSKAYIHTLVLPNEASNGTSPNKSLNNLSNPQPADAQYIQQTNTRDISTTENPQTALLAGEKQYNPEECLPKLTPYLNKYIDPESHFSQQCAKIRVNCYKIVEHRIYETILIFTILLSSIALVFEDIKLNEERSSLRCVLYWADVFFCIFFSIEMIMKVIAYGLRKYFTNWWCCLDFFIVTVSVISIYYTEAPVSKDCTSTRAKVRSTTSSLSVLRVLRTMRALRPLRALSRFQGMRVVVDALMKAIPSIMNVFLVCVIFWLIFSILGVNLFGGKFSRCVDLKTSQILPARCPLLRRMNGTESEADRIRCNDRNDPMFAEWAADKPHCLYIKEWFNDTEKNESKFDWETPAVNFDDVWNGYLALLQVATFMGWLEIMQNAVDIRGEDLQPEYESSMWSYVYFIIFIVAGSFFCLNLFIGVIIDNFNQQKVKKKSNGFDDGVFLTDEQRQYYDAMRKMAAKTPKKPIPRPKNMFAAAIYNLVTDRRFELAIMVAILLNMVVMAIESHDASDKVNEICNKNMYLYIFSDYIRTRAAEQHLCRCFRCGSHFETDRFEAALLHSPVERF